MTRQRVDISVKAISASASCVGRTIHPLIAPFNLNMSVVTSSFDKAEHAKEVIASAELDSCLSLDKLAAPLS